MKYGIETITAAIVGGIFLGIFLAVIVRRLFNSINKWIELESRADFVLRRAAAIDVAYENVIPSVHRLERVLSDAGKFESLYTKQREQADRIDALSSELASAKSELAQLRTRL